MKNFLKKINKNSIKKGITSIEAVIGTLIFLALFCAACDLIMLSNRYAAITDVGKELARTISVQGGALVDKPGGYASNYYSISQIQSMVDDNMKAAGFEDGEYLIGIRYTRVYNDATETSEDYNRSQKIIWFDAANTPHAEETQKIDYLSNFTLVVMGEYDWRFLAPFIPDRKTVLSVSMPGTSEWKYNYDAWESER